MSSLNVSLTLNDRLAQASKKFTKACEQIKLIKQQISEYIGMFAYCDGSQFAAEHLTLQQQLIYNNGQLFVNNNSNSNSDDFNHNLARETLRQKIETLQNFKSIFFMYAHQKAEEITKLQCELYGEEAVREAYDMAPPEVLIPANNSNDDSNDSSNDLNESNDDDSLLQNHNDTDWTNHLEDNNNNNTQSNDINTTNTTSNNNNNNNTTTAQLQLIEYSF